MVESSTANEYTQADKVVKIMWILNNSKYDLLRTIEGCNTLWDLNATTSDVKIVKKMAIGFGVKEENIFHDEEPTVDDLKKAYMQILKMSRKMSAQEQPHIIMVYCGGHGAT